MAKGTRIGRDAGSGKFIPVKTARQRPKTAVVETISRRAVSSQGGGEAVLGDRTGSMSQMPRPSP